MVQSIRVQRHACWTGIWNRHHLMNATALKIIFACAAQNKKVPIFLSRTDVAASCPLEVSKQVTSTFTSLRRYPAFIQDRVISPWRVYSSAASLFRDLRSTQPITGAYSWTRRDTWAAWRFFLKHPVGCSSIASFERISCADACISTHIARFTWLNHIGPLG